MMCIRKVCQNIGGYVKKKFIGRVCYINIILAVFTMTGLNSKNCAEKPNVILNQIRYVFFLC